MLVNKTVWRCQLQKPSITDLAIAKMAAGYFCRAE